MSRSNIDITNILNAAVREKMLFENYLDDFAALGLNTGTEVLTSQVRTTHFRISKPFTVSLPRLLPHFQLQGRTQHSHPDESQKLLPNRSRA